MSASVELWLLKSSHFIRLTMLRHGFGDERTHFCLRRRPGARRFADGGTVAIHSRKPPRNEWKRDFMEVGV